MLRFCLQWSKNGPLEKDGPGLPGSFRHAIGERFSFSYDDSRSLKRVLTEREGGRVRIAVPKLFVDDPGARAGLTAALSGGGDVFQRRSAYYLAVDIDEAGSCLTLINDPFGQLIVFEYEDHHRIIFATDPEFILQQLGSVEFNDEGLLDFVNFGCTVGGKTLFKGIGQLAGASEIAIGPEGSRRSTYWTSRVRDETSADPVPEVAEGVEAIESAVLKSVTGVEKVGIALSAGLDSRLITAALAGQTPGLRTFHADGYGERRETERIAKIARVPYKPLDLSKQDWSKIVRRYSALTFGHLHWNQFWGMRLADCISSEAQPPEALLNGYMLDGLFNCWHTPLSRDNRGVNEGEVLDIMRRFYPVPSDDLLLQIYDREVVGRIKSSFEANILRYFEANSSLGIFELQENFYLQNRGKNYTSAMFRYAENFVDESVVPALEPEIYSIAMRLPLEQRWSGDFYRRVFIDAYQEYARVRYPKLGGNLISDNSQGVRLKSRLVKTLRYHSRALSKGRLQIFTGKSINYYRFMRDKKYRRLYLQLLEDSQLQRRGYLARSASANIVRLLDSGNKNMMWHLQTLLTVDMFLHNYFGATSPSDSPGP
ncbi:MAG: hypothetical protein JSU87_05060 [Gemmatimonadota bacterium]|nr:MAG: hypothetical protein JSU87_05060 [Gemmatimonadota bacterium]